MKTVFTSLVVLLLGAVIFAMQSSRLRNLRNENDTLNKQTLTHSASSQSPLFHFRSKSTRSNKFPGASMEEVKSFATEWVDFTILTLEEKKRGRLSSDNQERNLQLLHIAQRFSPQNIETVIDVLQTNNEEQFIEQILEEVLIHAAPFSTLAYFLNQPHHGQHLFQSSFSRCAKVDCERAFALYKKHKENPAFDSQSIRNSLLHSLATHDPDRMFTLMTSPDFISDNGIGSHFYTYIFENTEDHLDVIAALKRAQKAQPSSEKLKEFRNDFIASLRDHDLHNIGFEEAQALISAGFSLEEKMQVFSKNAQVIDLATPEKWVKLYMEVELSDWNNWAKKQSDNPKHPLITLMEDIGSTANAHTTKEILDEILANVPAGELRSLAIHAFAQSVVDFRSDPETVAKYVDEIPDGKAKKRILQRIAKAQK